MAVQKEAVLSRGHMGELGDVGRDLVPHNRNDTRAHFVAGKDGVNVCDEEPVNTGRHLAAYGCANRRQFFDHNLYAGPLTLKACPVDYDDLDAKELLRAACERAVQLRKVSG